jgi:hypothetical protein
MGAAGGMRYNGDRSLGVAPGAGLREHPPNLIRITAWNAMASAKDAGIRRTGPICLRRKAMTTECWQSRRIASPQERFFYWHEEF